MYGEEFTTDEIIFNQIVSNVWKGLEIAGFSWNNTTFEDEEDVLEAFINQIYALYTIGGLTIDRPKCRAWLIESLIPECYYEQHREDFDDDYNEDYGLL